MGYHTYLIREDNASRFHLGKLQYGLQDVFQSISDSSRTMVLSDPEVLAELVLEEILSRPRFWPQPRDYMSYAETLAARMVRWGGGQPVVCRGDSELHGKWELSVETDSLNESEWPYYDVFQKLRPELWAQIVTLTYSPSESPYVSHVKSFSLVNYRRLTSDEERKVFLDGLAKLQPLTTNRDCGFLGCAVMGAHDHAPVSSPAPVTLTFCGCDCHVTPVVCTGFHFCCREVNTPRESQTPREPPASMSVDVPDFMSFRFPLIRKPWPKLFP